MKDMNSWSKFGNAHLTEDSEIKVWKNLRLKPFDWLGKKQWDL